MDALSTETSHVVVLVCADEEWKTVKLFMRPPVPLQASPFGEFFQHFYDVEGRRIATVFIQTGCGKMPAAAATQFAIDQWQPRLIVNLGTCGGFKGKVKRGDLLLVTKTVVYDIYERSGHQEQQVAKYMTEFDMTWLKNPYPIEAMPSTIATADQDLDPRSIAYLNDRYGAVAADWESGAIAYVAYRNNKKRCLIVRAVSDVVDPSTDMSSSEESIAEGITILMPKLLVSLPEWLTCSGL